MSSFFSRPESPTPSLVQMAGTPGCYKLLPPIFHTLTHSSLSGAATIQEDTWFTK